MWQRYLIPSYNNSIAKMIINLLKDHNLQSISVHRYAPATFAFVQGVLKKGIRKCHNLALVARVSRK